jgi:phosphoglucomutase
MAGQVSPLAGKKPDATMLVDVPRLVTAYFTGKPDPSVPSQRVAFGTSGHRGSAFDNAFNEDHILAISQAICRHRTQNGVDGPLYIGVDTHALSQPALASALEVFAANDVEVMIDAGDGYTPTPVVSHAILTYNKGRKSGLADGIVITPSHNPPEDGGFKYNPPSGGPADTGVTKWIENAANALIEKKLEEVRRIPYERARKSPRVHRHDYIGAYVPDLANVIDMAAIRASGVKIGIDPLGGASVHFWQPIIESYGLDATIVNTRSTRPFASCPWIGMGASGWTAPRLMPWRG